MRLNCIALVVVFLLFFCLLQAQAAISISPAYLELKLDEGRPSGKFLISNPGDTQERYRIQSIHFNFTPDGALQSIEPDEHSLAKWIVFNPKELTLPPKTTRAVRFVIVPKDKLQEGEYWSGMQLESLNTTTSSGKGAGGREVEIEIIPKILVTIFGVSGEAKYSGTVGDSKIINNGGLSVIETTVTNTGTGRLLVLGTYEISDVNGRIVASGILPKGYVFRGNFRKIKARLKEPVKAGIYAIKIKLESPQLKEALSQSVVQEITP